MATTTSAMLESGSVIHQAKFVDVDGIRTRYYEVGSGEPMVMCHGSEWSGIANANTWALNLSGLAENFHVFVADKLGNGMTDNPKRDEDYAIEAVVQHMYAFIRKMGIDSFHMVGQSRGGYLATRLALEHPEMTKTLVIVDSATLAPEIGDSAQRRLQLLGELPTDLNGRIRENWKRMSYTTDHVTDDFIAAAAFMESQPKSQETARKMASGLRKPWLDSLNRQKEETLRWIEEGRLTVPTLIFWGADDGTAILPLGTVLFDMVRQHAPRTHMHIVNQAGHFHYREYPDEFNRVVTNFIKCS